MPIHGVSASLGPDSEAPPEPFVEPWPTPLEKDAGPEEVTRRVAKPVRALEFQRRHSQACRARSGVKPVIPDAEDEFGISDGERASKMHGVGATKCVRSRELTCVALHRWAQLDGPDRGPVFLPRPFGCGQVDIVEVVIATGSCERRTDIGVGEATGQGGVAAIPHVGDQVAAGFFHDQLHQSA